MFNYVCGCKNTVTLLNRIIKETNALQNYPSSWIERHENGTITGGGVAFMIVEVLRTTFNFTYEVVVPDKNFEIGGSKPEDSIVGLVNSSVSVPLSIFLFLRYVQVYRIAL